MNKLRILLMNTLRILLMALAGVATSAGAATFVVNRTDDDGSAHTLRWAILESNNTPGRNRIEIRPPANTRGEWVIRPVSLLPHIVGPAVIEGLRRGGGDRFGDGDRDRDSRGDGYRFGDRDDDAPEVVIDGSKVIDTSTILSCPAENGIGAGPNVRSLRNPALAVVDSGNVDISGLEIRNFCMGVMLLRSHDNRIHHNVIHDMVGKAGVLITGDAGDVAGSATTGLSVNNIVEHNVIYNTGDGANAARGSTNVIFRFNRLFYTPNAVNPASEGFECPSTGNDNIYIIGNTFSGYSEVIQLQAATNVLVEGNVITASTYGVTARGTGVVIRNNVITGNRMGVGPANTAQVTITRNAIYNNGQPILLNSGGGTNDPKNPALLGIDVGENGVTPNDLGASCADALPDCGPVQNFPILGAGSSWQPNGTVTLVGTLPSRPNARFTIDFYASHALNAAGFAEGEVYLGSLPVVTDATGKATFSFVVPATNHLRNARMDEHRLPPGIVVPRSPLHDGSTRAVFTATATNANGATSEFSSGLSLSR